MSATVSISSGLLPGMRWQRPRPIPALPQVYKSRSDWCSGTSLGPTRWRITSRYSIASATRPLQVAHPSPTVSWTVNDGNAEQRNADYQCEMLPEARQRQVCSVPAPPPPTLTANDPNAVDLGVKFQASTSGTIVGIRFTSTAKYGTHTGDLWAARLCHCSTSLNETAASGWH